MAHPSPPQESETLCTFTLSIQVKSPSVPRSSLLAGYTFLQRRRPEFWRPCLVDETLEAMYPDRIEAGDVVGIGIHTANALRGYEIGE